MAVETRIEGTRGCGVRKPGGLYLVSGELSEPCPLLPYETHVCPTCGEGIRPARGFTWVDGEKFIPPVLHGTPGHNLVCPLSPKQTLDGSDVLVEYESGQPVSKIGRCGLIWIGEQHYKTPREFMAEAAVMGVSRRITTVPRDFVIGGTWVLLGHRRAIERACSDCGDLPEQLPEPGVLGTVREVIDDGTAVVELAGPSAPDPDCPVCKGTGYEHRPGIITAFRPTAVEYVVKGDESEEEIEALEKRGITAVKVVNTQASLEV